MIPLYLRSGTLFAGLVMTTHKGVYKTVSESRADDPRHSVMMLSRDVFRGKLSDDNRILITKEPPHSAMLLNDNDQFVRVFPVDDSDLEQYNKTVMFSMLPCGVSAVVMINGRRIDGNTNS